jgi:hypothetical protein
MYHNIREHHGQLISFGMDFSEKLLSHHSSLWVAIPYLLLVVGSVGLQYLQMSRLNARNPGANQANPQAAMLQKYMPLIFGFIYINVAAILNVYFIISSGIRILTQEILFRKGMVGGPPKAPIAAEATEVRSPKPKGPAADRTERALPKPKASGGGSGSTKGGQNGTNGKSAGGAKPKPGTKPAAKPTGSANGSNGKRTSASSNGSGTAASKSSTNGNNGSGTDDADTGDAGSKEHPRSKAKRARKDR